MFGLSVCRLASRSRHTRSALTRAFWCAHIRRLPIWKILLLAKIFEYLFRAFQSIFVPFAFNQRSPIIDCVRTPNGSMAFLSDPHYYPDHNTHHNILQDILPVNVCLVLRDSYRLFHFSSHTITLIPKFKILFPVLNLLPIFRISSISTLRCWFGGLFQILQIEFQIDFLKFYLFASVARFD